MQPEPTDMVVVFRSRDPGPGRECRLVMEAAGLGPELVFEDGWWLVLVPEPALPEARAELAAWQEERSRPRPPPPRPVPVIAGGGLAVLAYAACLLALAVLSNGYALGQDWFDAGVMRVGLVRGGEWWRMVTALTLHGDAGHLAANLVFGAVFTAFAAQALGNGVACLAILASGGLGNAMNALVQGPGHSSLGASTAVFAALGILVAHALRHRGVLPGGPIRRLSPLVGGIALLAYTGTGGERTDVVAHLTGFLAGLGIGWFARYAPAAWLRRLGVQAAAGLLAAVLLSASWWLALSG